MKATKYYDYIIAGAGAAGLSLAYHLLTHPLFSSKKILIIDKEDKKINDRTWCFWERGGGLFESCVTQEWSKLKFASPEWEAIVTAEPYRYKMIESHNFYKFCWNKIHQFPNVDIVKTQITSIESGVVRCVDSIYQGEIIFNSALFKIGQSKKSHHLLQHFKGWYVDFEAPILDPQVATLMDFDIAQGGDCRFVYVLPISKHKALVEYTVFSKSLLNDATYEEALGKYISLKFPNQFYQISHTEYGVIPMTNATIDNGNVANKVFAIGTAGYATKASTGYTFPFIQRQCRQILKGLENGNLTADILIPRAKFRFYDAVLLNVLATEKFEGWKIFTRLFKQLPAAVVLKFLNEESTFTDDLKIMMNADTLSFTRAAIEELPHFLRRK